MEPIRKVISMRLWCVLVLVVAASAASVWAQAVGTVAGTVVEAASGDALEAVQVSIPGPEAGAQCRTRKVALPIPNVPAGAHELRVDLIGYDSRTVTVAVTTGETATVELRLASNTLLLDETGGDRYGVCRVAHQLALLGRRGRAAEDGGTRGRRQLVDFFKNLGASHGVIGERNSWVQLRPSRGHCRERRQHQPARLGGLALAGAVQRAAASVRPRARLIGGRFVDVNTMPSIAIDRIEVLKEGASAVYGSDAVGWCRQLFDPAPTSRALKWRLHATSLPGRATRISARYGAAKWAVPTLYSRPNGWAAKSCWRPNATGPCVRLRGGAVAGRAWATPGLFFTPELSGGEGRGRFYCRAQCGALVRCGDTVSGNEQGFLRPPLRGLWRSCRGLDLPLPLHAVGQPHREDAPHPHLCRDQRAPSTATLSNHVEGLWSQATIPDWLTTPSFPPFPFLFNGVLQVAPDHPGREVFCEQYGAMEEYAAACSGDADWYFRGRPVGNTGPGAHPAPSVAHGTPCRVNERRL